MLTQSFGKAGIVRVGEVPGEGDQSIPSLFEIPSPLGEGVRGECFLQQAGGLTGEVQRSPRFRLVHLLQIFEQMAQAFLFEPVLQTAVVVSQEPIGGHDAGKVFPQDIEDDIAAAVGPDGIDGEVRVGEDPQLSQRLELPLCGIDLKCTPDGDYYCFEVNPSPAYSYYQENSGHDIASAIIR